MQKSIRPIPQTIAQCTQPNATAIKLRKLADTTESASLTLFILGMIGEAVLLFASVMSLSYGGGSLFLLALLLFVIFLIMRMSMKAAASVIFAFADLVEDQRICANLLLYHEGQANIERYQRAKEKQESMQ